MQTTQPVNTPVTIETENNLFAETRLSSREMSQLWLIYQANSSIQCILQYFVATAQDAEIKALFDEALNEIPLRLRTMTHLFNSVGFPIPHGFNDKDVELSAKRLYSDSLMLAYVRTLNKFGMLKLANALPLASRPDVRECINSALVEAQNLMNKTEDLLSKKGISVKPPYTPVPRSVNYVTGQNYYGSLLGEKRPINVLECTHVFGRLETKLSESAILLGFAQVAKDKNVKAYFSKGIETFDKIIDRWSSTLKEEDLPAPFLWPSEVTDSTESPFSDKLMLFHLMYIIAFSITANGFALGSCNRNDLLLGFNKSVLELGVYGKKGLDIMIEKSWLEEIPLVADREQIIGLQ